MNLQSPRRGFTLIELLVVISIIAMLIAILLPALGAARRTARQSQSAVNLRSMHQTCVMYGGENKTYYPGLDSKGVKLTNAQIPNIAPVHDGAYIVPRFLIMVNHGSLAGEHLLSPADSDRVVWNPADPNGMQHENISYAALDIRINASTGGNNRKSWRDNMNGRIPVFSERNTGETDFTQTSSHWSENGWEGSIAWNDGHTSFENTSEVQTQLEGVDVNDADQLFDTGTAYDGVPFSEHVRMIKRNNAQTSGPFGASGMNP